MDQAQNAVWAREILVTKNLVLKGPETSILGFYNGPLWYYWVSIAYFFARFHPIGAVIQMVLLNLAVSTVLAICLSLYISYRYSLCIVLLLQFMWQFYDTSRYSFNPHPLPALAILLILALLESWSGHRRWLIIGAVAVALTFHTELASFPPLFGLFLLVCIIGIYKRRIKIQSVVVAIATISLFFIPHLITELETNFSQLRAIQHHQSSNQSFLSKSQFGTLQTAYSTLLGESVLPQLPLLGILIYSVVSGVALLRFRQEFTTKFILLTITLVVLTFFWFGSNTGWHPWHTVYISPLIFISLLLILYTFPIQVRIILLLPIITGHLVFFGTRYIEYISPSDDASLLINELKAIEWTYNQSSGKGFYVYSYLPSVYDYPYQYLYWWYGIKRYGYVPCEYSSFPGSPDLFIPGKDTYTSPQRPCEPIRFLIIEPDKNYSYQDQWLKGVRENTTLLNETRIGTIRVEKRQIVTN